jgi:hypothetical protein
VEFKKVDHHNGYDALGAADVKEQLHDGVGGHRSVIQMGG